MVHSKTAPLAVGRYLVHGALASGGMATVHFGMLMGSGGVARRVAIKRLHPQFARDADFVAMFLDEARLAARIHHPNVVALLDFIAEDDELFLVMEYIEGESLARLQRILGTPMAPASAVAIVAGSLRGLAAAHGAKNERGEPLHIVHRDVSPQNILVGIDGVSRVLDFGVAKAVGKLQTTKEGQIKGKVAYMAPEQLTRAGVDARADIYASGVVLWEALTGRRLFDGDSEGMVLAQVLAGADAPPSDFAPGISPELDAIVMSALAADPRERIATAREMAQALEAAVALSPAPALGEWVSQIAATSLAERAEAIARMETGQDPRIAPKAAWKVPTELRPAQAIEPATTILESVSEAAIPARNGNKKAFLGGALLAVAVGAGLLITGRRSPPVSAAPSEPATATQTALAASQTVGVATADAPVASAIPIATALPKSVAPRLRPQPGVPPVSKAPNCDSPYTLDAQGKMHWRPECR